MQGFEFLHICETPSFVDNTLEKLRSNPILIICRYIKTIHIKHFIKYVNFNNLGFAETLGRYCQLIDWYRSAASIKLQLQSDHEF